jgi:hypothetical protein
MSSYDEPKIHAQGEADPAKPLCKINKYDYHYTAFVEKMTCQKCLDIMERRNRTALVSLRSQESVCKPKH